MRGIKIKKFFEIVNPEYHVFKLTTNNSVRNNTTGHIATAIASIHMQIWRQIEKDKIKLVKCLGKDFLIGTKYTFNQKNKVLMYIHIEKESVNFFVLIPSRYEKILLEKMSSNWKGVTIEKVNEIEVLSSDSTKFSMLYDKEDPLSLRIDLRDNDLLSAQLNVLNFMEKEDKAAIIYNFIPVAQNTWKSRYDATISKIKEKQPIDREKTGYTYLFKRSMGIFIYVLETIFEAIGTKSYKNEKVLSESLLDGLLGQSFDSLSKSTIYKRTAINLDVQIIIAAKSKDKLRQNNLAKSLVQSFDVISEDNRLKGKKYKGNIDDLTKFIFASAERNTVSDREASNLLALPGRSLLEQYGCIPKIETHETLVPEDLQNGDICVGTNVFRGNRKKAF